MENILKAIEIAKTSKHVLVATVDGAGRPHLALARAMSRQGEGHVGVIGRFCPEAIANLQQNPAIALAVLDPAADLGYQLKGDVEAIEELSILNGYAPDIEEREPLPQAESRLVVRLDRIIDFSPAPRRDAEVS